MRKYFAYLFGEVKGPFSPDELKRMAGFNRGTMVYPEDLVNGTPDDWKPAFQIAEFGNIPFSTVKAPAINPARASERQQIQTKTFEEARSAGPDPERTKLKEHIQYLEVELRRLKGQSLEAEVLKSQLAEKDQKIYELTQELRKARGAAPAVAIAVPATNPEPVQSAAESSPVDAAKPEGESHYTELDVPMGKIMLAVGGVLLAGVVAWTTIPGSSPNLFIRRLFTKKIESEVQSVEPPVEKTESKPKTVSHKKPKPAPAVIKSKSQNLTEKQQLEQQIIDQNEKRRAAAQKVKEMENSGVTPGDPKWLSYIEAQKDAADEEAAFRRLGTQYIDAYGEAAWKELSDRVKKSNR